MEILKKFMNNETYYGQNTIISASYLDKKTKDYQ